MFLRFETIASKKFIGKSMRMSLKEDKTAALWHSFMINCHGIVNAIDDFKYSIQVYDQFLESQSIHPGMEFTKWAAVEVPDFSAIPPAMEKLELPEGAYAVFLHKGPPSKFRETFQFIFGTWLPGSSCKLDHRPHFELLGPKYKNNHPESEEEVWIPIKTA